MEISNELNVGSREQLRAWLSENHDSCDEVWIVCCRSDRVHTCGLPYLDVVYEALCFGWIDSTCKRVGDKMLQRLTPRKKGSNWTAQQGSFQVSRTGRDDDRCGKGGFSLFA